jgi:hypothetical protein
MKSIRWATVAACVALVALIGCRGGGQVYQVKDAPVQTASGKDLSLDEVRKEIVAAGVAAGWQMVPAKSGEVIGTLNIRSHQAVVSIPYTTKTYSSTRTARTSSMTRTRKPYTKIMPAGSNDWMAPSARAWPLQEVNS